MADVTKVVTADDKENAESMLAEIHKRITEAFEVFDHEGNKTVDVREVGTIIRSMGCCPMEAELHDMLAELEEEETPGFVKFDKFLPLMTKVLLERRYKPSSEEQLIKAFQVLDSEGKGFLTQDRLNKLMMEEGEPFTQEEMEEMLSAAVNVETGNIIYKDFLHLMVMDDNTNG